MSTKTLVRQYAWLALLLAGCGGVTGPALSPVTGKITYQNRGIPNATVIFSPEASEGGIAMGVTDAEGNFTLSTQGKPGCVTGKARVSVTAEVADPNAKSMTPDEAMKLSAQGQVPVATSLIPTKYAAHQTSGLTAEVTTDASKNHFDYVLAD